SNASNEPALDSANIQYGGSLPSRRMYQTCSSGLVELSINAGNPTVAASNDKICHVGFAVVVGCHASEGTMGISKHDRNSNPPLMSACQRGLMYVVSQCS